MTSVKSTKSLANGVMISLAILLFAGISTAQSATVAAATKEYKRLVNLGATLRKIPIDKEDKEPHRSFLKRNAKDIVYSDPAGQWYVRSVRFWALQKRYKKLAIADKIAWTAAENSIPGECEGYIPCHLSVVRITYGEYLTLYPKGIYSRKAVQKTVVLLGYMADDAASTKKNYDGPIESSDDAEFTMAIKDLRRILSKTRHPETAKALSQLKLIEEAFE